MASVTGEVRAEGFQKVQVMVGGLPSKLFKQVKEALIEGAVDLRNTMISSMRDTPKTGRAYRRGGKIHIASSPYNPPAIDTGELVRSITMEARANEVEVGAESGAPYAKFLEGGSFSKASGRSGASRGKMLPRPFMKPALDKHLPEIRDKVKAIILGATAKR
jgi:hypothetical protein